MTDNQDQKYIFYTKVAWAIYIAIAVVLMAILVLFVASDNEERFFYGLMTPAAFYVFRPTHKYFDRLILKYTGVTQTSEQE